MFIYAHNVYDFNYYCSVHGKTDNIRLDNGYVYCNICNPRSWITKIEAKSQNQNITDDEVTKKKKNKILDLENEFKDIIGLEELKRHLKEQFAIQEYLHQNKDETFNEPKHLVFLGNPGTGKTTIARLLGKIYKAMGLLSKGHVVECDRSNLIGVYLGSTEENTINILNEALGGILFIDEAYTLYEGVATGHNYGKIAIDIILKFMEDNKEDFMLIVAGYPNEMKSFLNSNPGLKSRFKYTFPFEDYTPELMLEMSLSYLRNNNFQIEQNAEKLLLKYFQYEYSKRDKFFGNARFVRNLTENIRKNFFLREAQANSVSRRRKIISEFDISPVLNYENKEKDDFIEKFYFNQNPISSIEKLKVIANLLKIDKTIHQKELELLSKLLQKIKSEDLELQNIIIKLNDLSFFEINSNNLSFSPEESIIFIEELREIAKIDGDILSSEEKYIKYIAELLNISSLL